MTTYARGRHRAGDATPIRFRIVVSPVDDDETVNIVLEDFGIAVDEIREAFAKKDPSATIVLDAYVTKSPDPLADEDHEPIDIGDTHAGN